MCLNIYKSIIYNPFIYKQVHFIPSHSFDMKSFWMMPAAKTPAQSLGEVRELFTGDAAISRVWAHEQRRMRLCQWWPILQVIKLVVMQTACFEDIKYIHAYWLWQLNHLDFATSDTSNLKFGPLNRIICTQMQGLAAMLNRMLTDWNTERNVKETVTKHFNQ